MQTKPIIASQQVAPYQQSTTYFPLVPTTKLWEQFTPTPDTLQRLRFPWLSQQAATQAFPSACPYHKACCSFNKINQGKRNPKSPLLTGWCGHNTQIINSFVLGLYSILANVHLDTFSFHAPSSKQVQLVAVTCIHIISLSFVLSLPPPFYCIVFQLVIGVQQSTQFSDLLDDLLTLVPAFSLRGAIFPETTCFSEKKNKEDKIGGIRKERL